MGIYGIPLGIDISIYRPFLEPCIVDLTPLTRMLEYRLIYLTLFVLTV
jgi:hypothetical protein